MNAESENKQPGMGRARWIAFGFLGAMAASVLTVIYTGLMVEGSRSDFDVGFRSVTMAIGESRLVEFSFDAEAAAAGAELTLSLPPEIVELAASRESAGLGPVDVDAGENTFSVELRALAAGQGYLVARVIGEEPIALDRVFLTVAADEDQ